MKTRIKVQNLKCGGCASTIMNRLSRIEGTSNIQVDVQNSVVSFECENSITKMEVLQNLKSLGYPSADSSNSLLDKTMSYVSCATGKMIKS